MLSPEQTGASQQQPSQNYIKKQSAVEKQIYEKALLCGRCQLAACDIYGRGSAPHWQRVGAKATLLMLHDAPTCPTRQSGGRVRLAQEHPGSVA